MKKFFLISIFLGLAFSYGFSQTYYYKAVASINKNGVKSKPSSKGMYVTFADNKSTCYESDKNGYKTKDYYYCDALYFKMTQNGTHVYQDRIYNALTRQDVWRGFYIYYFSSDFDKMQFHYMSGQQFEERTEYVRTNGPEDDYDDKIPTF